MSRKIQGSHGRCFKTVTTTCAALGLALGLVGLLAGQSQAAAWLVDASANWNTPADWSGGVVPNAAGAVADFSTIDITADRTITLSDASYTVGSLIFGDTNTATAGSWIIAPSGSNTLTLDNGGGTPTITVNALGTGKVATISSPIGGYAGLTKDGAGTLVLSGANTFSGNVAISNGTLTISGANTYAGTTNLSAGATLNINNATALGSSTFNINGGTIDNTAAAAITLTGNNAQNWNGDFTFTGTRDLNLGAGGVTLGGNRQVTVSASTLTVGGTITGGYKLTKAGTGTLILSGFGSNYSGGTTISAGALVANTNSSLPNWDNLGSGAISVAAGATLAASTNWTSTDIDTLRSSPSITWANGSYFGIDTTAGNYTYGSNIATANVGVNKIGPNTLTLSGTNTYTGGTTISAGVLVANTNASLPNWDNLGSGAISVAAGATLAASTNWTSTDIDTLRSSPSIIWANGSYFGIDTTAGDYTYGSNITAANMGINKLGANALILSGNNTYTGGTVVTAGTLQMGSATALGAATGGLTVNGTLDLASYSPTVGSLSGTTTGIITSTVAGTNTLTVNSAVASTYNGTIVNGSATAISLVKGGAGSLTLGAPNATYTSPNYVGGNTYTGGTTISGGSVVLGNNAANCSYSTLGTGIVTFQGGSLSTVQNQNNSLDFPSIIYVPSGQTGTITLPNRIKWGNASHTMTGYTQTGSQGAVFGSGTLNVIVTSTVNRTYLENNWNYTGTYNGVSITPFTGTVNFSSPNASPANVAVGPNVLGSGDPYFPAASWTSTTVNFDNIYFDVNTNSGGNTMLIGALNTTATATLAGSRNSAGTCTYSIGALNQNNTIAGNIGVSTGGGASNIALIKTGTGTLTLAGTSYYTGTTTVSGGTLQIGNGGATGNLGSGAVSIGGAAVGQNANLSFNRNNTLVVPNAMTKSGSGTATVTVNGGTIYLNGAIGAGINVTVNSGAVVGGQGTISGAVTVNPGGGIEAGQTGAGNQQVVGSLTFVGAGSASFTPTFGTMASPLLTVTNGVTTNNLGTGSVVINILGAFAPANGTYDLIKYGTTITNYNDFSLGTNPGSGPRGPKTYTLQNDPSNKQINLVVGGAVGEITWTGAAAGSSWDTTVRLPGTTNWKFTSGGAATDFYTADNVTFDDSGAKTVNISSGDVVPGSITVNNSVGNDYTFQGTNGIGNGASLLKNGAGKLTISNNNSFTGGVTVNAGTIAVASDGATGGAAAPLGAVPTAVSPKNINLNGGALSATASMTLAANRGIVLGPVSGAGSGTIDVVNAGQTLTYGGIIANNYDNNGSSVSSLNKTGLGTLLLNGANVFSGETVIAGGVLQLGNSNALQYSALNYNNQGGTLSFGTLTAATIAAINGAQGLDITGVTLTVGNTNANSSYSGALSGSGSITKIGTGTITLSGVNTHAGATRVNLGSLVVSGTGALNTYSSLYIGENYSNGAVTFMDNSAASLSNVEFGQNLRGGGTFTIQDNANVMVSGNFDLNNEVLGSSQATNNPVNLNGGTLTVGAFTKTRTDANKLATLNFNGTLVKPSGGGSGTFLPALTGLTAYVQAGGVKLDDMGGYIEIDQALLHDPALGATPDGGLSKSGAGTLVLGGNNTFTGPVTINAGIVQLGNASAGGSLGSGAITNNGSIVLNRSDMFTIPGAIGGSGSVSQTGFGSTAILASPNTYTGPTTVTAGTLSLRGSQSTSSVLVSSGGTLAAGAGGMSINALTLGASAFDAQGITNLSGTDMTTILVLNPGGLVANGTTTIAPQFGITTGTHVVVDYTGAIGGSGFAGFALSLPLRISGSLVNNVTNTSVDLNVTAVKYPKWNGNINNGSGAGDWDIGGLNPNGTPAYGTQNWKEYSTGSATVYQEGPPADPVFFDDTATGLTTVNLTTVVQPVLVTVNNNAKNYTFTGGGKISGSTQLVKTGTGTLTLSNTGGNDYTGGTKLSAGTLAFDTGALPAAPAAVIMDGGTLKWNGVNADDVASRLSFVSGQTAVLDLNGNAVTFASPMSFDSTVTLTKVGSGTLTITNNTSTFTGPVNINGGTVAVNAGNNNTGPTQSALGNPAVAHNVFVNNGATLRFDGGYTFGSAGTNIYETLVINAGGTVTNANAAFTPLGPIVLNGGTLTSTGGGTDPDHQSYWIRQGSVTVGGSSMSTISGTGANSGFHLANPTTFDVADATGNAGTDLLVSTVLANGTASGSPYPVGSLIKTGAGTMTVTVNATYSHNTTVNAGVLDMMDVTGDNVYVNSGALIAKSITVGTLNVAAGATVEIKPITGGPLASTGPLNAVPEPATWAMLALAAMGLGIYWRRSR